MSDDEQSSKAEGSNNVEDHVAYDRFHIPHEHFMAWWKHLQAAGWSYLQTTVSYQAPPTPDGQPGRVFDTAKDVTDYLNAFALPPVYTNLQWAASDKDHNDNDANDDKEEHARGRALRRDVLQKCWERNPEVFDHAARGSDDKDKKDGASDHGGPSASSKRPRRPRRATTTSTSTTDTVTAVEQGADLYLRRRRGGGSKGKGAGKLTSVPTLSQRLSLADCQTFLETQPMEAVEHIEATYRGDFAKWRFLLSTNHSLLFYGAGSKRVLLNSFAQEELYKEGESLVIDGTDKDVTMEGILDVLVQVCLGGQEPQELSAIPCPPNNVPVIGRHCPLKGAPVVERAIMVGRGLAHAVEEANHPVPPTFLVIHSLDAQLATPVAQEALSMLVINSTVANGVAALRLVASVDHVDAPAFLWKPVTEANFAWFPCCVHTHRPFGPELNGMDEDVAQRKKTERANRTNTQAQRILDVLQNLAPRHTEVVQLLARLQANHNDWVDYLQYRERCKSACAINKDSQLRSLLTELKDHGLVVSKTEGSNEFVRIPFSEQKLREIIQFERDP